MLNPESIFFLHIPGGIRTRDLSLPRPTHIHCATNHTVTDKTDNETQYLAVERTHYHSNTKNPLDLTNILTFTKNSQNYFFQGNHTTFIHKFTIYMMEILDTIRVLIFLAGK